MRCAHIKQGGKLLIELTSLSKNGINKHAYLTLLIFETCMA